VRDESAFTFIEVLIIMVILGILMSLAMVVYIGFRDRSSKVVAQSNIRSVLPALSTYYQDESTYVGATLPVLRSKYDLAIDDTALSRYTISGQTGSSFCIQNHIGDWYAWTTGPAQPIQVDSSAHC
jgi:type II secretory pathway pseudopilin PulG